MLLPLRSVAYTCAQWVLRGISSGGRARAAAGARARSTRAAGAAGLRDEGRDTRVRER